MFKKMFGNLADQAKRFSPAALTPEKRFAKALVTASSVMTMADGKAEDTEIESSSAILFNHRSIKQFLSPTEAQEMYSLQISKLQEADSKGKAIMLLEVNGMVAEIADSVKENHWRQEILEIAKMIGESNGSGRLGEAEQGVLNKLRAALA